MRRSPRKGSHQSPRVINALILLNCNAGEWNGQRACGENVAPVLYISMRKLDRVKKRFVEEGLEAARGRRKGGRRYKRKADGDFEARRGALSCSEPPKGHAQWSPPLLADQAVERDYVDSVPSRSKKNQTVAANRRGNSPPRPLPSSSRPWRGGWMFTGGPTMGLFP